MKRLITLVVLLCVSFNPLTEAAPITIDTLRVGNAGNLSELQSGYGAVGYDYLIGKYEVTNAQYAAFLNGVDPSGANTLRLYHQSMFFSALGGINFDAGANAGSKYTVKLGHGNNPVAFVSWYDAVRFANWLHNGQGAGDTENGAYTLGRLGAEANPLNERLTRNPGARWFLPSEDEWYKAAYHKNDGVTGNYWAYPTTTNTEPFSDQPPGNDAPNPSNTANILKTDQIANGYDDGYATTGTVSFDNGANYLTNVGAYPLSISPYGTLDQGGNLWEWNEALLSAVNCPQCIYRGLRGSSWDEGAPKLRSDYQYGISPGIGDYGYIGFRVATIPEPNTLIIASTGFAAVLACRRKLPCRNCV
jgi:sulfatase modifying factor 1